MTLTTVALMQRLWYMMKWEYKALLGKTRNAWRRPSPFALRPPQTER
jgi:hypothetical protein